ncbi:MAG: hypothetical protein LBS56_10860 [Propionibacteriaceae bacterium]|jgi:hypothetical protein|nr:hypothetical protein [Propionibacteriaceae bacterium]
MPGWAKKAIGTLAVAFVLFYIVARPDDAAGMVRNIADAGQSVVTFFRSLAS